MASRRIARTCYAAALGDCAGGISREHYISKSVLESLTGDGRVTIQGYAWQAADTSQVLPVTQLVANILCVKHNSQLSSLDAVAQRMSDYITESFLIFATDKVQRWNASITLDGKLLERWLLKTFVGILVSGSVRYPRGSGESWSPDLSWLEMLFARTPFPTQCGLHLPSPLSQIVTAKANTLNCSILSNPELGSHSVIVTLNGISFLLTTTAQPSNWLGSMHKWTYRPSELILDNGTNRRQLRFDWSGEQAGSKITIGVGYTPG